MSETLAWTALRGFISREYTVWCGVCGNWTQTACHLMSVAAEHFRRIGWKNTRANGWTCPKCLKEKT